MNIVEIISKKANNNELSREEINFVIDGLNTYIKDYQLSAFLMAVKINGFNNQELLAYTDGLINSGKTLPLSEERVDKHSTGGIGDKVSLILFPMLEALDIKIFKFSGRSLGFTGGTIDKLDTIKNFRFSYSYDEILNSKHNLLLESTSDFTPADKITYAMRDASGSTDSFGLIAASIMSKKIASGAKYLFIDLKCGSGAFISNLKEAKTLAKYLKLIADHYDRKIFILITNMNEPLGFSAGNAIEVQEAIDFFEGKREEKLSFLIEKIVTEVYHQAKNVSKKEAKEKYYKLLESNTLKQSFFDWIKQQEGELTSEQQQKFFVEKNKFEFKADSTGYFKYHDLKEAGFFLISIKAGRTKKGDKIYPYSGITFNFKNGDKIKKGDVIFTVYSEKKLNDEQLKQLTNLFEIKKSKISKEKIILDEIVW